MENYTPFEKLDLVRPDSAGYRRSAVKRWIREENLEVETICASVLRLVFSEVSNQKRRKTRSRARPRRETEEAKPTRVHDHWREGASRKTERKRRRLGKKRQGVRGYFVVVAWNGEEESV